MKRVEHVAKEVILVNIIVSIVNKNILKIIIGQVIVSMDVKIQNSILMMIIHMHAQILFFALLKDLIQFI